MSVLDRLLKTQIRMAFETDKSIDINSFIKVLSTQRVKCLEIVYRIFYDVETGTCCDDCFTHVTMAMEHICHGNVRNIFVNVWTIVQCSSQTFNRMFRITYNMCNNMCT